MVIRKEPDYLVPICEQLQMGGKIEQCKTSSSYPKLWDFLSDFLCREWVFRILRLPLIHVPLSFLPPTYKKGSKTFLLFGLICGVG